MMVAATTAATVTVACAPERRDCDFGTTQDVRRTGSRRLGIWLGSLAWGATRGSFIDDTTISGFVMMKEGNSFLSFSNAFS